MNFKLTLTLAVILLLAAIVYMLSPKNTPPSTAPSGSTPLLVKKPEGLKSITYLRDGSVQVRFDKDGENWTMSDPVKASVDSFTVGNIASALTNMSFVRKFEPEASGIRSPEATGTAKPHNIIKFTDNGGVDYTVALGFRANDGTFATLNGGQTIYVLESTPLTQLDKNDVNDFRNKTIKQVDTTKITKLEVKNEKGSVTLAKIDGKWLVTAPVSARANSATVQEITGQFQNIQALKFSPLNKTQTGVDPGLVTVTAWVEESTPATASAPATTSAPATAPKLTAVTLQLGYAVDLMNRETSNVYASLAGSNDVFTYGRDAYTKMNKELKDLRDAAVVPVAVRQATTVTLTTDNVVTLSASSKGQAWTLATEPKPMAGDPFAISEYLGVIGDLRAIKFVDVPGDLKSLALDPPHMKIELTIPGQTQHEVLLVGKPEEALEGGKMTPVMRQGEPTVYLVQALDGNRLAASLLALRDKEIQRLDADKLRKIEIAGPLATAGIAPAPPATAPATGTAPATASAPAAAPAAKLPPGVTLEREGSHWVIKKSGETLTPDDSKITSLLGDFTPLTASKYLDEKALAEGTPDITVTLTVLEPAYVPPAATTTSTAPAAAPATSTAPATGTAPASAPATRPTLAEVLPANAMAGPDAGKLMTYTLRLYRQEAPATASAPAAASAPATAPSTQPVVTWKAVWDNQSPAWTFEPNNFLVDQVSKEIYTPVAPATATAPATRP